MISFETPERHYQAIVTFIPSLNEQQGKNMTSGTCCLLMYHSFMRVNEVELLFNVGGAKNMFLLPSAFTAQPAAVLKY